MLSTGASSSSRSTSSGVGGGVVLSSMSGVESSLSSGLVATRPTNTTTHNIPLHAAHATNSSQNNTVPPPSTNPPSQPSNVPVWRSVSEKSALRGYLAVLGVTPEASLADIRLAYKKLALQWHPDRSDAPNARMKFQEISSAYMALCVEEGDAQDIDAGLYEREAQASCEVSYLSGLAGVTAGLAGVFCGVGMGGYAPFLGLNYKSTENLHLDLFKPKSTTTTNNLTNTNGTAHHALACTCHAHAHLTPTVTQTQMNLHSGTCQQPEKQQPHTTHGASTPIRQEDINQAVMADVGLLTGLLPPPVIASGDTSVQVRIAPLAGGSSLALYQIELKIKKSYQLVYQGPSLTYTVPNLIPGTKYMFRVRCIPLPVDGSIDEENLDQLDEVKDGPPFSQPTTVTTQGIKPDGNQPHPPVLSNLQIAVLNRKQQKAAGKKKAGGGSKSSTKDETTSTSPSPDTNGASSNTSTPGKTSRTLHDSTATPPTHSTPVGSPATSTPSTALSKKEAKLRAKAAEEVKRAAEAQLEAQRRIEEEVAYQKFLLEAREQAERVRVQEEQEELERYAELKKEQDIKRAAEEKIARKNGVRTQTTTPSAPAASSSSTPTKKAVSSTNTTSGTSSSSTPSATTRGKKTATSPSKAVAVTPTVIAPIMHIKLTPEQQAALKQKDEKKAAATSASLKSKAPILSSTPASIVTGGSSPVAAPKQPAWSSPVATASVVAKSLPAAAVNVSVSASGAAGAGAGAGVATNSPHFTGVSQQSNTSSPIIRAKPPGAKPWAMEPTILAPLTAPALALGGSASASHAVGANTAAPADSLSEHLNRFDASKPWHADLLAQQQQQTVYEPDTHPTARYQHIAAYTASHSLLPSVPTSAFSSTVTTSAVWGEDDLLLSDLHHELERQRWNAAASDAGLASPTSAAAEAAWNSTANTTIPSHTAPLRASSAAVTVSNAIGGGAHVTGGLQFTPLSSLLSDYGDSDSTFQRQATATNDGIYMSTGARSFFGSSGQSQSQSTPAHGLTGLNSFTSSPSTGSATLTYSNLSSFPTTGLSRDAPSFNPIGIGAITPPTLTEPTINANANAIPSTSGTIGHTRLPLSHTSSLSSTTPAPLSNLFGGFSLPSFSSFSSFGSGSSGADWGTHSSTSLNPSVTLGPSHLRDETDHVVDEDDHDGIENTDFLHIPSLGADEEITFNQTLGTTKW